MSVGNLFARLSSNAKDGILDEGHEPIDFNDSKGFNDPRLRDPLPVHQQHLQEMEHKLKQLMQMDQDLVDNINAANRNLASVRMAIRGVEDMMASIRANPIVPPVMQSITEYRSKKANEVKNVKPVKPVVSAAEIDKELAAAVEGSLK